MFILKCNQRVNIFIAHHRVCRTVRRKLGLPCLGWNDQLGTSKPLLCSPTAAVTLSLDYHLSVVFLERKGCPLSGTGAGATVCWARLESVSVSLCFCHSPFLAHGVDCGWRFLCEVSLWSQLAHLGLQPRFLDFAPFFRHLGVALWMPMLTADHWPRLFPVGP